MVSPCIKGNKAITAIKKSTTCTSVELCNSDLISYALSGFTGANKKLIPIGLAKDGHIIYGPYKNDGTTFSDCDVDICNGAVINGRYGYASTTFHPYFMGCYGPGSNLTDYN
jgi:hypothetical protein